MIKIKWRASFILLVSLFFLSDCSRFKKKEKKKSPIFHVHVPLEEDYTLLKLGLISILELSFPKPNIFVEEGLSDKYEIAPFEDWINRTDPDFILKLQVKVERAEDLAHVAAFLNRDEAAPPFKINIPKFEAAASEYRGESLFCRMQIQGQDILSKQVCKFLQQSLCFKDLRPQAKRLGNIAPARCEMILAKQELSSELVQQLYRKELVLTGFPLPLKVKNDYPFSRFVEVDETLLLSLFGPTE